MHVYLIVRVHEGICEHVWVGVYMRVCMCVCR